MRGVSKMSVRGVSKMSVKGLSKRKLAMLVAVLPL